MTHPELEARGRAVLDGLLYMVLGTVDADGRPWVTPVYFSADGGTDFYWVSSPGARHSRNIAERPDVSIVVFDSTVPIGGAQAVYMRALAGEVPVDELERCAPLFAARVPQVRDYTADTLRPPAELRLYRATVSEHSVLVRGGDPDYGQGIDSRVAVDLS